MLWELNKLRSDLPTQSFYGDTPGTRIILVRHGQSTYNAQGRHQGSSDESVLTQAGIDSAQKIGVSLRGMTIDALYASPLKRAQETAREILTTMGLCADDLKVNACPWDLREIDLHGWQGLPLQYVQEQFADDYRCWRQRPHEFRMEVVPNQSSSVNLKQYCFPVLDLYERAQKFWEEILPHHVGQTLLLVGHSGINRALIATALGLTPDRYHAMQQSNCGISILNFPGGDCFADTQRAYPQQVQIEALNLTTQLGETLPKPKGNSQGLRLLLVPSGDTDPQNVNPQNINPQNINPQPIQKLAKFLEKVSIEFSISGDIGNSQILAEQILQYHRATVQLQVLREDFPQIWQKTIEAKNSVSSSKFTSSDRLVTGLVVARTSIIKSLIGQVLGLNSDELCNLQVYRETISVIHYPSSQQRPPMLQAMNISPGEQAITSIPDSSVSSSSFMASSTLN
ncbi:histidine phosphatase family protein [Mastigocoleus testarum]|uniref:Phosphoglycerate mutase n=1 Tax=Mastigocoleus testarum BC008 TaxID=371196 RepID=A0A0V7ZU97_9CYAN|nr:histidine phosphatase family protein [Mastigocoleus testarum]KST67927.1 hypothetical protein BC008_31590 [Mastigocoleus testarum BC008]